ncbi:hypothetical protein [Actinoplanes sp. NPDC051851]|uniref:hypothetical protein n=1 Tax=Actinoplanes sp. NPDC051851 TaxID=3154753 RepID=UPI00342E2254
MPSIPARPLAVSITTAATLAAVALPAVTLAAVTLAAVTLPAPALASPSETGDRSVLITVANDTRSTLSLVSGGLAEGRWSFKPPKSIGSFRTGTLESESSTSRGGVSGSITYRTAEGDMRIFWNNPYYDDSEFSCDAPGDWVCLLQDVQTDIVGPSVTVRLSED